MGVLRRGAAGLDLGQWSRGVGEPPPACQGGRTEGGPWMGAARSSSHRPRGVFRQREPKCLILPTRQSMTNVC